jgi:hypothetical protein
MITHVAIWHKGELHSLPSPNRHHHIIYKIAFETGDRIEGEQGFLDDQGNYLNRVQALKHALECGQHKNPDDIRAGRLFSEDVW